MKLAAISSPILLSLVRPWSDELLINLVIEQMINDSDPELGGAVQLIGILRLLLDPENMLANASKTEFLNFFYKHSMHVLTAPLFANTADNAPSRGALRFCRKIIGLKEELYNKYIIKGDLVRPIVDAFLANGDRYTLINSAMTELFEFIKVEDIKSLSSYIVETFQTQLEGIQYVKTFESLKIEV